MSALRVLHVAPYSPQAWAYGGIPRVVAAQTRGLSRRGHAVTLCATDVCSERDRLSAEDGTGLLWKARPEDPVQVQIFPNLSNRLAYQWQLFTPVGLGRFLKERVRQFDVAHLHACRNLAVTTAARILSRAGVPFVLGPNGTAPRIERRHRSKLLFDLILGNASVRRAAGVLATSEAEKRQLVDLGISDDRIHLVPNPVDLDEFSAPVESGRFRAEIGCGEAPIVLFLGKITPRKRVTTLVEAFARTRHHDARLVIAGSDMGSLANIRSVVRTHGLDARTVITGLRAGRQRLEALADATVVVYPSEHEVFGLVPLEAILCGVPVVVADDSGCGEIIAGVGGGEVVPVGDAGRLARAIDSILDTPDEWRVRAAAAAGRIRTRFGSDVVSRQLEQVYAAIR